MVDEISDDGNWRWDGFEWKPIQQDRPESKVRKGPPSREESLMNKRKLRGGPPPREETTSNQQQNQALETLLVTEVEKLNLPLLLGLAIPNLAWFPALEPQGDPGNLLISILCVLTVYSILSGLAIIGFLLGRRSWKCGDCGEIIDEKYILEPNTNTPSNT